MSKLPYSRTVNVTLSRNDAFPSRRGFGTPLFLTIESVAGEVDATHRTKLYASMEEVAADWDTDTDFYAAALQAFAQNPRPVQIKAGFVEQDSTASAAELLAQLDLIYAYDTDFYWLAVDSALREQPAILGANGLMTWVEAKNKQAIIDSNDVATESAGTATSIAAVNKGNFERSSVFYHTDADYYPGFVLAALLGTHNFDEANSAYTAKFKNLKGIAPIDKASAVVSAITGFVPGVGQAENVGHMANTYIDIGGRNFVAEGSTLTPNVFIDEIHATDWIIARTEEESLGILLNNKRVPFTDRGMEMLASAARTVMRQAFRAGLVADDLNPLTGLYEPAVNVIVPSVFDVPESQRKARIAPEIQVRFRYAGAVHYTTIHYQMTF